MLNIYYVRRTTTTMDYDYSDFVVIAINETVARNTSPSPDYSTGESRMVDWSDPDGSWVKSPDDLEVTLLGQALSTVKAGVICSSFHAG